MLLPLNKAREGQANAIQRSEFPGELPVLPLRNVVAFPDALLPLGAISSDIKRWGNVSIRFVLAPDTGERSQIRTVLSEEPDKASLPSALMARQFTALSWRPRIFSSWILRSQSATEPSSDPTTARRPSRLTVTA